MKKVENVLDYCSNIILHNNHVLIYVEGKVSTSELNVLINEQGKDNKSVTDKFFAELMSNHQIVVKVSKQVAENYPEIKIGDRIQFNAYGNPRAIFMDTDPNELDNLIEDYKHDKKDKSFNTNTIGFNYTVRCYYTYEASATILTKTI
jgi:hypothetical protein